jgi:cholestenol Delta-isomerase
MTQLGLRDTNAEAVESFAIITTTTCGTPASTMVTADSSMPSYGALQVRSQRGTGGSRHSPLHPREDEEEHAESLWPAKVNLRMTSPGIHVGTHFTSLESRYFEFFRTYTTTMTGKWLDSQFWNRLVLQAVHKEPAVKHGVLGLSALHQRWQIEFGGRSPDMTANRAASTREDFTRYAQAQYSQAVTAARTLLAQGNDVTTVLIICLIFICYENLMGRPDAAQLHRINGLRILEQRARSARNDSLRSIYEVFTRVDLDAMTLQDSRAPYPYNPSKFLKEGLPGSPREDFEDISAACGEMMAHIKWLFQLYNAFAASSISYERFNELQSAASASFRKWEPVIKALEISNSSGGGGGGGSSSSSSSNGGMNTNANIGANTATIAYDTELESSKNQSGIWVLQLYYTLMILIIDAGPYGAETRWDYFYDRFERIIELSRRLIYSPAYANDTTTSASTFGFAERKPVFCLEPGVVIPLSLTTHRCRDPALRRSAIALLKQARRMEGTWGSWGAASVAEKLVQVEEEHIWGGVNGDMDASAIPETARVQVILPIVDKDKHEVRCRFLLKSEGMEQEYRVREVVVGGAC